jgi:hypothetical protein
MRRLAIAIITVTLLVPTVVWAWGADHPKKPVNKNGWPKGLAELVNAENRVHGYFVNWEDVFFFKGDTAALNDFLTKYAQLPDTTLRVVIHPGRLNVRSPWDKEPRDIVADWRLYASPLMRDAERPGKLTRGPFVTRVDVCLGGSVKLTELRVPDNVSVESGGEIEAFVNARRAAQGPATRPTAR